jgi:hypothetical protein
VCRLVVIVLKWITIVDLARRLGTWQLRTAVAVRTGALSPVALVFDRLECDEPKRSVHRQLDELNAYFNFSGEHE